jgi:putative tryptophan/tyrosine transport system substrate-binding protein
MPPSARRVVALGNAPDPFSKPFLEKIQLSGKSTGITIGSMMINGADELEGAFAAMEKDRPDALHRGQSPFRNQSDQRRSIGLT